MSQHIRTNSTYSTDFKKSGNQCIQKEIVKKQTEVQTLIFDKKEFPKRSDATKWAKAHGFRTDKVDETENSFRLRQKNPNDFISVHILS